jgi:hypothetical protein
MMCFVQHIKGRLAVRNALLIGLMIAAVGGAAAMAQTNSPYRNPYGMGPAKDPYDLPKPYQTNPYNRDYSKPDRSDDGPGYRNVDGSTPRRNSEPSYGGYGSRSTGSNDSGYGSSSRNRDLSRCRPGIVC